MFASELLDSAERVLAALRSGGLRVATAESCTGGLIAALLTEIPGASDVLDRGFVTYSNASKVDVLAVEPAVIERHGAVSAAVASAMASGALLRSPAEIAVAVTGIAGPGGGSLQKPVGLVYIAVLRRGGEANVQRFGFGDQGRTAIRLAATRAALDLVADAIGV